MEVVMKKLFLMTVLLSGSLVLASDSGMGSPEKSCSGSCNRFQFLHGDLVVSAAQEHKTTYDEKGVRYNAFEALCANRRVNEKRDGTTALHEAVKAGILANVNTLLYWSANPNVTNANDETPLHLALLAKREDIAQVLKTAGASKEFSKQFFPLPVQEEKAPRYSDK